jgi:hypothetical protein
VVIGARATLTKSAYQNDASRLKELEADQAAADRQECLVDVGASFVVDAQSSVLV